MHDPIKPAPPPLPAISVPPRDRSKCEPCAIYNIRLSTVNSMAAPAANQQLRIPLWLPTSPTRSHPTGFPE
jgi:hypothetical protein